MSSENGREYTNERSFDGDYLGFPVPKSDVI